MSSSNELVVQIDKNHALSKWDQHDYLEKVKEVFGADLSPIEFEIFLEMGKSTGLNPFLREIWAVKYDKTKPAQIFIGRDGYRKAAQQDPDYEYHYGEAVYANDHFTAKDGIYEHSFNIKDRGALRGAFCVVKKKSVSRPFCLYVPFEEYNKQQQNWRTMPSTMIKKVAEAQCLRMSFQDIFSGTYAEEENWVDVSPSPKQTSLPVNPTGPITISQKVSTEIITELEITKKFNDNCSEFMAQIDKKSTEDLGKYPCDETISQNFRNEFFKYFKEEYIKSLGNVSIDNLFSKKLLAMRLNVLAVAHNAVRPFILTISQLDELKRIVCRAYLAKPDQNLIDIFAKEAKEYVPF